MPAFSLNGDFRCRFFLFTPHSLDESFRTTIWRLDALRFRLVGVGKGQYNCVPQTVRLVFEDKEGRALGPGKKKSGFWGLGKK